jgi:hypothetical protein
MRDGVVAVAVASVLPSVSLLQALKREFGFYCIQLFSEMPMAVAQSEMAIVMGGMGRNGNKLFRMERYNLTLDQWSAAAGMDTARSYFGVCAIAGELYIGGGVDQFDDVLSSVEKYSPLSNTWSNVTILPEPRV